MSANKTIHHNVYELYDSEGINSWNSFNLSSKANFLLKMLAVNLFITFVMELGIRELSYAFNLVSDPATRFFQTTNSGFSINSQSLINLFMTFFATLLSVKVFYGSTHKQRYFYFVSFCVLLSFLAQLTCSFLKSNFHFSLSRLGFDLLYGMTIKYMVFHFYRRPILEAVNNSIKKTFRYRVTQDFILSCFKFACLTLIGLKD